MRSPRLFSASTACFVGMYDARRSHLRQTCMRHHGLPTRSGFRCRHWSCSGVAGGSLWSASLNPISRKKDTPICRSCSSERLIISWCHMVSAPRSVERGARPGRAIGTARFLALPLSGRLEKGVPAQCPHEEIWITAAVLLQVLYKPSSSCYLLCRYINSRCQLLYCRFIYRFTIRIACE